MNLRQIEAFYWIARLGSFHAAARHLKMRQPSVSARVQELERHLGVQLFDRSGRNARLTPKGRELLTYADEISTLDPGNHRSRVTEGVLRNIYDGGWPARPT